MKIRAVMDFYKRRCPQTISKKKEIDPVNPVRRTGSAGHAMQKVKAEPQQVKVDEKHLRPNVRQH